MSAYWFFRWNKSWILFSLMRAVIVWIKARNITGWFGYTLDFIYFLNMYLILFFPLGKLLLFCILCPWGLEDWGELERTEGGVLEGNLRVPCKLGSTQQHWRPGGLRDCACLSLSLPALEKRDPIDLARVGLPSGCRCTPHLWKNMEKRVCVRKGGWSSKG